MNSKNRNARVYSTFYYEVLRDLSLLYFVLSVKTVILMVLVHYHLGERYRTMLWVNVYMMPVYQVEQNTLTTVIGNN